MPLSPQDSTFLKGLFARFDPFQALDPDSKYYQTVYASEACEHDPLGLIESTIQFSVDESLQFLSGFRGAGKTTELQRLKQGLEKQGFVVLYANALEYLNPAEPVEIEDLLTVLVGSFGEELAKHDCDITEDSYWGRFWNFLTTTEVVFTEFGIAAGDPKQLGASIKGALKTSPTFRQKVKKSLENRLKDFRDQAHKFVEEGVRSLRKKRENPDLQVVFIFDQLEQIRGTISKEEEVFRSLERIFTVYPDFIRLPYVHGVFAVPPWLKLIALGPGMPIRLLPCIRQWHNDDCRTPHSPGCSCLRELLLKRFETPANFERFFGERYDKDSTPNADRLIDLCGGHFRDLLRAVRECIVRTRDLPVSRQVMDSALQQLRGEFFPIAEDDAVWMAAIARGRSTGLKTKDPKEVNRLTRLLDMHFVLYLMNGEEWYDVHPLIREEVEEIAAKVAARAATTAK
jgi:hypothetical protein